MNHAQQRNIHSHFFHAFHNVVKTFTKSHLIIYQAWQLVKTQDNFSCNSKSMGIHFAHNTYKKKIGKIKKIRPDFAPLNLLFFRCLLATSGRGALLIMPSPLNFAARKG